MASVDTIAVVVSGAITKGLLGMVWHCRKEKGSLGR